LRTASRQPSQRRTEPLVYIALSLSACLFPEPGMNNA
jgi:hypothetical protein